MDCKRVKYTGHALRRMFERGITSDDLSQLLLRGEVIEDYPTDQPCPSCLLLAQAGGRPLHAVVARDPHTGVCSIVTVYEPDPQLWTPDYRTRRTP